MTQGANPSATRVQKGRLPDFFIVGHPKSGTSALYRMLQSFPEIHMPRKEPSFFVPELRSARSSHFPRGIDDYLAMFDAAAPEQQIGEATPSYLFSHLAAGRIAEVQPRARIIAILREPASFLRSLHLQFIRSNVETERDLRTALALETPRREGRQLPPNSTRPQALAYSEHVRYAEQLQRYYSAFPADQVLVLIYEDFRADNERTVRQVLRFLGVDDTSPVALVEVNPAASVRAPRLYGFVRSLYLGRAPVARTLKLAVKSLTPQRVRHKTITAVSRVQQTGPPPPPDVELMRELRTRFKGEVEAVSELLNRDLLSFWGYDDID